MSATRGRRVPIGEYGLVGDTRSGALVAPDGAIDWWCVPRFDDPPLFGRLVGGADGGYFAISPVQPVRALRRTYREASATLVTTWTVDGAELELADALIGVVDGRLLPGSLLVRRLTCRGGPARVVVQLAPRFGYDRSVAARARRRGGALLVERGDLALAVTSDGPDLVPEVPVEITVSAGRSLTIALAAVRRGPLIVVPPAAAAAAVQRDERAWHSWSTGLRAPVEHAEIVRRSLITLRLLTYSPSGAPVAAPTTSLPELLGGSRNWDYRFAWPRDAAIGISAFLTAGQPQQARAFLAWLLHASRLTRPHLPVLFTVLGQPAPAEQVLRHWPGYGDSPPVRRGNAAASQHQLDGYGWVLNGAWQLTSAGHRLNPETWRTVRSFADYVAATWRLPDAGIWEERGPNRHHVHSKLMAWVALDRAVQIASARGESGGARWVTWAQQRDAVAADIRASGVDAAERTYTATYGGSDVDAALLLLPGLGFDPPASPLVRGTVDAIRAGLSAGAPLIYRYHPGADGLPGGEGAFLPCSFWLVEALALTGRREHAADLFAELCALGGSLGLFAEEMDPVSREHMGNFPQALTHAALVQAAAALDADGPAWTRQRPRSDDRGLPRG